MNKYEKVKKALRDYRLAYWLFIPRFWLPVSSGLCYYSIQKFGSPVLPEELKKVGQEYRVPMSYPRENFWFPPAELGSRITVLKETLKRMESTNE